MTFGDIMQVEWGELFFRYSGTMPDIEEQLYLYMKRFRVGYTDFMKIPTHLRTSLFAREYKIIKEEQKN